MTLNKEEVIKIAKLANLSLTEDEINSYAKDLNQILNYVEQLQELDTKDIEPMVAAIKHTKDYRPDQVLESSPDAMLANAPDREDSAIKVPKMG